MISKNFNKKPLGIRSKTIMQLPMYIERSEVQTPSLYITFNNTIYIILYYICACVLVLCQLYFALPTQFQQHIMEVRWSP